MLAPLLGAVGGIASTLLSNRQANENREAQSANQARQEALQREFAQNGIQWKVEDAKKAGIHPLYALGANTQSYSPSTVGSSSADFSGLSDAGQNIGRAIDATRNPSDKTNAVLQTAMAQTQLDGAKLDNDIKRAQLASAVATNRTRTGIPAPGNPGLFDGQPNAPAIEGPKLELETKRDITDPTRRGYVPGAGPSVQFRANAFGGFDPVMPNAIAEALESDLSGRYKWQLENRVLPNFTWPDVTPDLGQKHDEESYWDTKWQDWRIRKKQYGPPSPPRFSSKPKR